MKLPAVPPNTHAINRALALLLIGVFAIIPAALSVGASGQGTQTVEELSLKPIFVTTRVFQLRAKSGSYQELTDQVFKMRTASFSDESKWATAFKKTYPGFDVALLRTELRRVFRTSKPSVVTVAKHADGRRFEMALNGAHSPGDGEHPGTSLISEIALHFANENRPVTYSMQTLEVQSGMTYFHAIPNMKMNATDYSTFLRPDLSAEAFKGNDFFLVFAYSVELNQTTEIARYLDERQSMQLQEQATKKVQPEIPSDLRDAGLGGFIRVRVEISAEGKVTSASIQYSSFPELNNKALLAARQWEFPATLFAENKNPITGFIAFSLAGKRP